MFDERKVRKSCFAAYNKLIVPELKEYCSTSEGSALPESAAKRHTGGILRITACLAIVSALTGVIIFQNSGGAATKTGPARIGTSAQESTVKDSFALTAYAAAPTATTGSSGPSVVPGSIDSSTAATLQPNVAIKLPTGKVDNSNDGIFYYSSCFGFSGNNIDTITMTANAGLLWGYNKELLNQFYKDHPVPGEMSDSDYNYYNTLIRHGTSINFPPDFTVFWEPSASGQLPETITFLIRFKDGTTQTKAVIINKDASGNIAATLNQ